MSDRLSSALEEIQSRRDDAECVGLWRPTVAELDLGHDDIPRLLAAVRAVLELADSAEPVAQEWVPGHGHRFYTWTLDPAKIRAAISREITGEVPDA